MITTNQTTIGNSLAKLLLHLKQTYISIATPLEIVHEVSQFKINAN